MRYCCENCFSNKYLKEYIKSYDKTGSCNYCDSENVNIISTKIIGGYIRECLDKAYEDIDDGTGAIYDSEDKEYYGRNGALVFSYSIQEILIEKEEAIDDIVVDTQLLKDIFKDSGPSYREISQGVYDKYDDIEGSQFVIKYDLYGQETTKMFYAWEIFKHTVKHYNRFFDMVGECSRKEYLNQLRPYIMEYENVLKEGTILYRARKYSENIPVFDEIDVYNELSPAPPQYAITNRMSPAGISYLYLASDKETAFAECRCKNQEVLVSEYVLKEELQIIDFSKSTFVGMTSIFSEEYDHDLRWINQFLKNFVSEITRPVDDDKEDHSYEYISTQLIAEYIRSLGYEGICFNSSVGNGKSYVFFCGPNIERNPDAYNFPNQYIKYFFPMLKSFTEWFKINRLELNYVYESESSYKIVEQKIIKDTLEN